MTQLSDTGLYSKRIIASLNLTHKPTYTFSDWQGTGKELVVHIRNIIDDSSWHAVLELNFNEAAPNDSMTNLIICGYQGWFAYPGDGAPINKWKHWFSRPQDPSISDLSVEMYPYTEEYDDEDLVESNIFMKDGSRAKFYSAAVSFFRVLIYSVPVI